VKRGKAKQAREGASQARTRLRDRYNAWVGHHRLSAAESLQRILDAPLASLLTWLVIGVALTMPVALWLGLENLRAIGGEWDQPARLSVFLEQTVSEDAARALADEVAAAEDVLAVDVVLREAALEEFRENSGFADVLSSLEENPLPHLLLVAPVNNEADQVEALQARLAGLDGVDSVVVDTAWLERLRRITAVGLRLTLVLAGLLGVGVVIVLGNTIRLAIEARREEIVITKLVGGSNAFVRRPFLYTGLWYGLGGGLLAALLTALGRWLLGAPIADLAAAYQSDFLLRGLGLIGSLQLVLLGGLLGLAGAWLAVARHLRNIEPK
jgi:cell division transport system permease protein